MSISTFGFLSHIKLFQESNSAQLYIMSHIEYINRKYDQELSFKNTLRSYFLSKEEMWRKVNFNKQVPTRLQTIIWISFPS